MSTPLEQAVPSKFFRDDEEKETFLRRLKRSMKKPVHQNSVEEFFQDALRIDDDREKFPFALENLNRIMNDHPQSKTVMGLLQSAVSSAIGMDALKQGDIVLAASALTEAYKKNSMVVRWETSEGLVALESFNQLYSDPNQDRITRAEAVFVHGNLMLLQGQVKQGLTKIRVAQRLLAPNEDPYFSAVEGCVLAMQMDLAGSQKAFKKAARLGCDDLEHTLFHLAVLPTDASADQTRRISLLEEFVKCAEPDARKLPEACYRLAILHGLQGPRHLGAAKRFFTRGEKADQDRIKSLFPDDEASQWRKQARALVKRYSSCGRKDCTSAATKNCAACGQACYCSQDCQKADWPSHRARCRIHRNSKKNEV
jgi:tetratricopeptide (TPR) repeat protein